MNLYLSGASGLKFVRVLKMRHISLLCLSLLCSTSSLAQNHITEAGSESISIFVSILPQKFLVERITGNLAHVEVMIGPGQSPETFEPTPRQLVELADSNLYLSIGAAFEQVWLPRIQSNNKELQIIKLDEDGHGHSHDHDDDPHYWTSPITAQEISEKVLSALQAVDPQHASNYEKNYKQLAQELEALDKEIQITLKPFSGKAFLVMHPAWGHFAEAYGLEQVALEKNGKGPTAKELVRLIKWAKKEQIQAVFIQEQHSMHLAEKVANEINARVIQLDPLAEDYIDNLRSTAMKIAESFTK